MGRLDLKTSFVLFSAQDRVLGGFGDAEFHNALGRDLDGLPGLGITAGAGGAVAQHEFADARQCESVFRVLVRKGGDMFQDFPGFFLGYLSFFSDCGG